MRISFARSLLGVLVALGFAVRVDASTASGMHGAVATDQALASQVGLDVLRNGGNAVDAAVAIGYALAVTLPTAGNIGGGGFMLIRRPDGTTRFIDFRERAPAAATRTMYLDARGEAVAGASTVGFLAVGVPGTVAGLEAARIKDGTLSRHALLAPAIALADRGFTLIDGAAKNIAYNADLLRRFPASAAVFLPGGKVPVAGDVLRQPDLARTLRAIDRDGAPGFYQGDVARRLVAAISAGGGILTLDDLAEYTAVDRTAITCPFAGAEVITSPPPSSGGTVICETLDILGLTPPQPRRSVDDVHYEVEAERRAFADRNTFLGDPDFVPPVVATLLSPAHIAAERASIDPTRATPSTQIHPSLDLHEGMNTTHYSVIDRNGEAVAVTYTLNSNFGSGAVAGDTGVLLNDEMDDFSTAPGKPNQFGLVQGPLNEVAPGRRPLSSMAPTIVVRNGKPELIAGAAGGPHIITTTLDLVRDVVSFGVPVGDAMDAPRLHEQWLPDTILDEPGAVTPDVKAQLVERGYRFDDEDRLSSANAIAIDPRERAHYRRSRRTPPHGGGAGVLARAHRIGYRYRQCADMVQV